MSLVSPAIFKKTPSLRRYLNLRTIIIVLVDDLLSLLMAFPFIWMFSASLKVPATAFKVPPELWPYEWRWANYRQVIANPYVPMPVFFLNSLKIAVLVTLGQLVTCTLAGYCFGRLRFPGRDVLFVTFLTALMVPAQVTIIPTFILMRILGLVNTHAALIFPGLTSVFGVFLLRQFFLTIPDELEYVRGSTARGLAHPMAGDGAPDRTGPVDPGSHHLYR